MELLSDLCCQRLQQTKWLVEKRKNLNGEKLHFEWRGGGTSPFLTPLPTGQMSWCPIWNLALPLYVHKLPITDGAESITRHIKYLLSPNRLKKNYFCKELYRESREVTISDGHTDLSNTVSIQCWKQNAKRWPVTSECLQNMTQHN